MLQTSENIDFSLNFFDLLRIAQFDVFDGDQTILDTGMAS
jgi:hypothetical protein